MKIYVDELKNGLGDMYGNGNAFGEGIGGSCQNGEGCGDGSGWSDDYGYDVYRGEGFSDGSGNGCGFAGLDLGFLRKENFGLFA